MILVCEICGWFGRGVEGVVVGWKAYKALDLCDACYVDVFETDGLGDEEQLRAKYQETRRKRERERLNEAREKREVKDEEGV